MQPNAQSASTTKSKQGVMHKLRATNLIRVRAKEKMNAVCPEPPKQEQLYSSEPASHKDSLPKVAPSKKPNFATLGLDMGVRTAQVKRGSAVLMKMFTDF